MKDLKVGDVLAIHSYKHNGKLDHTSSEATVLDIKDDMIVCGNDKTMINESDGRTHQINEPAILFFYKDKWYNIIGQIKNRGIFYYCNIATPYIIEDGIIKYIDYDLDLKVFPDGSFRVLDRNEYKYHSKIMEYPKELDTILKRELTNLIEVKKQKKDPFKPEIIEKYYEIYKNIKKN